MGFVEATQVLVPLQVYETKFQNPGALFRQRLFDLRDYEIESDDLYEDLKNNQAINQEYDFSNYAEDNPLYNKHQKLETRKFKDEMQGKIIHSIIALKSKLYWISMGDKRKLSAKGTTKYAQKSLNHWVFYRILKKDALLRTINYTINSEKQKNIYLTNLQDIAELFRR